MRHPGRTLCLASALLALVFAAPAHARPLIGVASGTEAKRGHAAALRSVGARWTYDWDARSALHGGSVEFVPMAWGTGSVTDTNLAAWTTARRSGTAHWLLGFNEPDMPDQANISPARAIALWPRLQATGLSLVSPAVASPTTRSQSDPSRTWLDDFLTQARAKSLRVDAIALHFYGDWTDPATAAGIVRAIERVHAKWRQPIWVTELGVMPAWKWEHRAAHAAPTTARAVTHMRRVMERLSAFPYVARIAWFMDRCDGDCARTALLGENERPTALGRALQRFSVRER